MPYFFYVISASWEMIIPLAERVSAVYGTRALKRLTIILDGRPDHMWLTECQRARAGACGPLPRVPLMFPARYLRQHRNERNESYVWHVPNCGQP